MPDVLPDSRYSKNKMEKPDITNLRPDLADIINPIVKLKEELDKTEHHYMIMRLLQTFDELIDQVLLSYCCCMDQVGSAKK